MGYDFRTAYVPGTLLTGAGQVVALFEAADYFPSDIALYVQQAGLPRVPLQNVMVDGGPPPPVRGDHNSEVALDIEMAICMAPGLSKIIVYEGPKDDPITDFHILNRIATDNLARQISSSWLIGDSPQYAQIYAQFAVQGQSFFQASGDSCAYYPGIFQFEDSPLVTLVGGTTLTTTGPMGAWQSEMVWNWGGGIGSGGGISQIYPIPVWQQGISMSANRGSATMRNIPDVALTADNILVIADNGISKPGTGGTSAAAPLWAGFTALVNQQAAAVGQPPVGFLNPTIYTVGMERAFMSCFHDITTGNNTSSGSPNLFFAAPGYDLCTGWGTPKGNNLINMQTVLAPWIISQPQGQTVTAGESAGFSVIAGGMAPLNYQWLFNGQPISTATSYSYSIARVQSSQAGTYTVLVSNSFGSVQSAPATLAIASGTAFGIIGVPFHYPIIANNNPTWYSASGLPSGLSCNGTTGLISGTPA
jgi:subtilase family serine protease